MLLFLLERREKEGSSFFPLFESRRACINTDRNNKGLSNVTKIHSRTTSLNVGTGNSSFPTSLLQAQCPNWLLMECFWSAPNIFLAATCCPASILHRAQNCCLVSLYPVWFTVARKLVQMRKGGWRVNHSCVVEPLETGEAVRKWWWWPHGYPSSSSSSLAFETPFTENQPRHRWMARFYYARAAL